MAAAATSIEDQPIDNSQLWMTVFKLYDRDNSGLADEGDTIHAMMVAGRTQEQAKRMLARISEDGRVDSLGFQSLLEECVTLNLPDGGAVSASHRQRELVKHLLGVLREFEKRTTARGEFMIAAESRHRVKQIREVEQARQRDEMNLRQSAEKSGVEEAHVMEALEFNRAWTTNMEEFEQRAAQIIQELKDRQAAALANFVEKTRAEAVARVKPSKAVLDLIKTQEKLARSGNYPEAQKCQRKVHELLRKDGASMQAMADEGAQKRIEVFKRQQRLELEGLIARVERGRSEHKGHWAQGAARLMQSHKNMVTDLSLRQSLEANRVSVAIKTQMTPIVNKPQASHPRRGGAKQAYGGAPPPKLRPSKLPTLGR